MVLERKTEADCENKWKRKLKQQNWNVMREYQKHIDAFAYFLSLGGQPTRENCTLVSQKFQTTGRTFWNWYAELNWKERVDEIVRLSSQEVKADAVDAIAEWKREQLEGLKADRERVKGYMDTLHRAFEYLDDRMDDGVLVAHNMLEVMQLVSSYGRLADTDEKRVKTALLLMGEADSHREHSGEVAFFFGDKIDAEDI